MIVNLLGLDTSTRHAAMAVGRADGSVFVAPGDPSTRHGRGLVPALRDLLREAGLRLTDLDGLAVGLGPGSFTGLRVGVTAVKTLAYACGKPLIGMDSLEIVARNAPADAVRVAAVADAQRGDVFTSLFTRPAQGGPLLRAEPTQVQPLTVWLRRLAPGTLVLGPDLEQLAPLAGAVRPVELSWNVPQGWPLLELAREALAAGRRDDPWFLEPVYYRRSAAEEKADRQATSHP